MEALLFKTNHRTTNFSKEENKKTKRDENLKRTKTARELHVQNNRKIPENLELTNDSINLSKSISSKTKVATKRKQTQNKPKKPCRAELLKEWRVQKIKDKTLAEKKKKTPWRIAIHVEHKADQSDKENINRSTKGTKKTFNEKVAQRPQRVLREQNSNITKQTKADFKPLQKQSYADWKKTQEPVRKTQRNKPNTKTEVVQENSRPVTRSMRSKGDNVVDKNIKKASKNNKTEKQNEKIVATSTKDLSDTQPENIDNSSKDKITENVNDSPKQEVEENIFSILPTHIEEVDEIDSDIPTIIEVEPLVTVKTEFQPPEIFNNFQFNRKDVIEAIEDFIPTHSNPTEAELFNTEIPEIECEGKETKSSTSSIDSTTLELVAKTPVSLFKKEQGIRRKTPSSTPKRLSMSAKRASLTPNPMNFLHKNEDPIATRTETPKSRRSLVMQDDPTPQQVSEPEESASVKHFTNLVAKEESKFRTSIDRWEKILEEKTTPEQHHGNILAAIGQAQLFMRKRFNQFKELIELHKDKSAEKAAHASDLDGFWEMIYYQVEDVHKRFENLDALEKNGWVNEEEEKAKKTVKKIVKKTVKPKIETKAKTGGSKKSEFAKFRQQMMAKKKAEMQNAQEDVVEIVTNDNKVIIETNDTSNTVEPQKAEPIAKVGSPPMQGNESTEEILKPLRRSTRKTPSKYSTMNLQCKSNKKPEDVACNLFESNETEENKENEAPDNENDFTKYLSQTVVGGHPVQRDLLTSFDTPVRKNDKTLSLSDDLMVFASPLPNSSNSLTSTQKSTEVHSKTDEDLLLL
ncbi:disks large-associated protein 5-like isoform X2 [Clytia hemisphaerica]|uniref:disks large-associated protein 5-like isoform X2 n=1 Tax=Clytia hemisphaerica TaxID=252671 RepID=UPI0034D4C7FD